MSFYISSSWKQMYRLYLVITAYCTCTNTESVQAAQVLVFCLIFDTFELMHYTIQKVLYIDGYVYYTNFVASGSKLWLNLIILTVGV